MKISVVIPAYNEEKYIRNSLNSLKQQVEQPDEIIIVDNLSQDKTILIAKEFNVKVIEGRTKGIGHARSIGFDTVQNEIIARCDADTVVPADWIKKIKQNFLSNGIDALFGPVYYYDLLIKSASFCQLYIVLMNLIQGHHVLIGPNMAISK